MPCTLKLHASKNVINGGGCAGHGACNSFSPKKECFSNFPVCVLQVTGLIVLAISVFAATELHKYMLMSPDFAATGPYIGIGIGSFMCLLALLACCCGATEQPILLKVVS